MRVSKRYIISGRVQGVGFRYFTQRVAGQHGISGWVRNTPDGRVEIEAEGDASGLREFESRISTGPAGARVDHVDITEGTVRSVPAEFLIR